MDGYAVLPGDAGRTLTVVGESRAGTPSSLALGDGERDQDLDRRRRSRTAPTAVIPQENVEAHDGTIITRTVVIAGDHIRGAGEDMRSGETVLRAGVTLGAAELGAAVAAGVAELTVYRRPRVQVLCTGDELRAPGEPLGPGEIHNSNAPMLDALAAAEGAIGGTRAAAARRPGGDRGRARVRARRRGRRARLRRGLGRARTTTSRRRSPASASRRCSGGSRSSPASRPGSAAGARCSCSDSRAIRSRPS